MTTSIASRQTAIDLLKWVRGVSDSFVKDFPTAKVTYQPSPTDNHVLWVLGHLAATDGWIANTLGITSVQVPESYAKLFGGGSKPSPDAAQYPSFAEVSKVFQDSRASLLKWFESAPEAALKTDLKDTTGGFTSDPIDAMFKIAWHEGWHFGQVANVRKALGLPSVMG